MRGGGEHGRGRRRQAMTTTSWATWSTSPPGSRQPWARARSSVGEPTFRLVRLGAQLRAPAPARPRGQRPSTGVRVPARVAGPRRGERPTSPFVGRAGSRSAWSWWLLMPSGRAGPASPRSSGRPASARAGHRVVAAGRRVDRLEALRAELGDERLFVLPLDVRDGAAVAQAIAGLPPDLAAIDLLVNNAGLALGLEPAHEASLDDWNQMVNTNCKGLMTVTRAVLPGDGGAQRGHVVNLGSTAASWPYAGQRLRRHQGVRAPALAQPARRPGRDARAGHRHRAGWSADRVLERALSRRRRARRPGVRGRGRATPGDVAETVFWVATLPERVNINLVEMMPVSQSFAGYTIRDRADRPLDKKNRPRGARRRSSGGFVLTDTFARPRGRRCIRG